MSILAVLRWLASWEANAACIRNAPARSAFGSQLVVRSQMVRERHAPNEPTLWQAPTVLVGADERHFFQLYGIAERGVAARVAVAKASRVCLA